MQAVILAGGFGTRLAHVVTDVPKPMAPIDDKPFLDYQIELLRSNGFDDFILLTGYKAEIIENYYADFPDIRCIKENLPLGTGGAVLNAYPYLKDEFYVINGDTFFDVDFSILADFVLNKSAVMALRYSKDISRYGLVDIDDEFIIKNFVEKGNLPECFVDGYINGGIYYLKKSVLQEMYQNFNLQNISMENEIFPLLIEKQMLYGLPMGGAFIDIGIPQDYAAAQKYIPQTINQTRIPVLFVDKDGTLIVNDDYPHGSNINIIDSTETLLRSYLAEGYKLIIVSNQAGLAKGKFSEQSMYENFDTVMKYYKNKGIEFTDFIFCPYHFDGTVAEYKYYSKARKPDAGMILAVCEKYRIDLKRSVMLGDNPKTDKIKLPYLKSFILKEDNV